MSNHINTEEIVDQVPDGEQALRVLHRLTARFGLSLASGIMTLTETVSHTLDAADNPEDEALHLFRYLMDRFGWAGTVMTREDAETAAGRGLTDREWDDVTHTWYWRKAAQTWNEIGVTWDTVELSLQEAGITEEEKA